jgi:FlaA1/EpsC-like NDP-sugar epimerase
MAWLLRFDFSIPIPEMPVFWAGLCVALVFKGLVVCVLHFRLENWEQPVTFSDLIAVARGNIIASLAAGAAILLLIGRQFPRSIYLLDLLVCTVAIGGARSAATLIQEVRAGRRHRGNTRLILIYGAGAAGLELAKETRRNPALGYRVIGFIDDDPRKGGAILLGLPVLGFGEGIPQILETLRDQGTPISEIVVAMPSAAGRQLRAAVARGRAAGVPCRIVPGLGELISGKLAVRNLREVSVTDLLGREPVSLDMEATQRAVFGRSILVTGAAGSIGTELCNQLAALGPRVLVVLDQGESPLFYLENELRQRFPGLSLAVELADICNPRRIEEIITEYGVEVILHAAAYKHVPIMERQICEAVRNNVIGTWNLVQAAWRLNVSQFLLISTDKAVNPSSVMGLTKRVAELIVSATRPVVGSGRATRFMSVRFGNVLVSNGSVVPIFQKQIAAGGPVTVTHPDMRRYFMTVQEAVSLVLLASTMGKNSEVFVLDMGKPVHIVELARKMISLAGLVPDEDIEIRFVGMRPGEKLYEDLSLDAESMMPTNHKQIRIFQSQQVPFGDLLPWITELQHLLWWGNPDAVVAHLAALVPEYQPVPALLERIPPQMEVADLRARAVASTPLHAS